MGLWFLFSANRLMLPENISNGAKVIDTISMVIFLNGHNSLKQVLVCGVLVLVLCISSEI